MPISVQAPIALTGLRQISPRDAGLYADHPLSATITRTMILLRIVEVRTAMSFITSAFGNKFQPISGAEVSPIPPCQNSSPENERRHLLLSPMLAAVSNKLGNDVRKMRIIRLALSKNAEHALVFGER